MYHVNLNVRLIVENVIHIKNGITINVDVSPKILENIMRVEKIISGIGAHVLMSWSIFKKYYW